MRERVSTRSRISVYVAKHTTMNKKIILLKILGICSALLISATNSAAIADPQIQKLFTIAEFNDLADADDLEEYLATIDLKSLPGERSPELRLFFENIAEKRNDFFLEALSAVIPTLLTMADEKGDRLIHHSARQASGTDPRTRPALWRLAKAILEKEPSARTEQNDAGQKAADIYLASTPLEKRNGEWYTLFSGSPQKPFKITDFIYKTGAALKKNDAALAPETIPSETAALREIAAAFLRDPNLEILIQLPTLATYGIQPHIDIFFQEAVNQKNDDALELLASYGLVPTTIDLSSYPTIDSYLKKVLETTALNRKPAFSLNTLFGRGVGAIHSYLDRVDETTLPQSGTASIRRLIQSIPELETLDFVIFNILLDHPKMGYLVGALDEKGASLGEIIAQLGRDRLATALTYRNMLIELELTTFAEAISSLNDALR